MPERYNATQENLDALTLSILIFMQNAWDCGEDVNEEGEVYPDFAALTLAYANITPDHELDADYLEKCRNALT
jgi:hypothetical protein